MSAHRSRDGFSRLQEGLTGERALVGAKYMDDPGMLRAYLDYYWPVSREQARRALAVIALLRRWRGAEPREAEPREAEPREAESREAESRAVAAAVIDVGSGPGPVAAAFVEAGASEVFLLDQSRAALELARSEIKSRCGKNGGTAVVSTLACDVTMPESVKIGLWGKADCVSFGHSLNELWAGKPDRVERRVALIEDYSRALAPGGTVLVIEPALLSTSRDLLAVRDALIARGWTVLAPCVGRERLPCPALSAGEGQTCHEDVAWEMPKGVADLSVSRNIDKEYLKMTWFLLGPPVSGAMPLKTGETGEAVYRVVSEPMLNKGGRLRRLACGESGRFPVSVAAESPDRARTGFDALSRGDFIAVDEPEIRENGWGIGSATKIRIKGDAS